MNGAAHPLVQTLWLLQVPLPGSEPDYARPESATAPRYIELLERNTHIIYPVIAVVVLGLLVLGILHAWRAQDLDGLAKAEFKREIILELRKQVTGLSAEQLSRVVGLEALKLVKLLEEMQRDGLVQSFTNTQRLTVWQLKGIGASASR